MQGLSLGLFSRQQFSFMFFHFFFGRSVRATCRSFVDAAPFAQSPVRALLLVRSAAAGPFAPLADGPLREPSSAALSLVQLRRVKPSAGGYALRRATRFARLF